MSIRSMVEYDASREMWFAWERGLFGGRRVVFGEIGSGRTPEEAYADLLRAVERKKHIKSRRRSPVYFDRKGRMST